MHLVGCLCHCNRYLKIFHNGFHIHKASNIFTKMHQNSRKLHCNYYSQTNYIIIHEATP